MKATHFLSVLSLTLAAVLCADRPEKPNVLFMLIDDLGWQDVVCYDVDEPSPYETPNMDKLSRKGVMFLNGYSPSPVCSPSRGAILSGKHPARTMNTTVASGKPPAPFHRRGNSFIAPWCRGGMDPKEYTITEALKDNGYTTGHVGKWHVAINHHAFPQPVDQGFDFSSHYPKNQMARGVQNPMKNRLADFATKKPRDPYRLDENGYPYDHVTGEALTFLEKSKSSPFFLYYASWLVHSPLQSRSKALLEKYCKKLGVDYPTDPEGWTLEGQRNPYYCAMVETLDYYIGQMLTFLETTEDPRWPGHKLIENTYLIFTSDNGGMEGHPGEIYTDNYPLDQGKIHTREGGVRVPFLISGPGISPKVQSEVVINGLDLYPTLLSLTNSPNKKNQILDGSDLSALLTQDPQDPALVIDPRTGKKRNTMFWHFPNGYCQQSTILQDGYKLIYNHMPERPRLELYQLYDSRRKRIDWEEANDLSAKMPELAQRMKEELLEALQEWGAGMTYYNPHCVRISIEGKDKVCQVTSMQQVGGEMHLQYREKGAKLIRADLIYSLNGNDPDSAWFPAAAKIARDPEAKVGKVTASIPERATHVVFNLIDENNFLLSHPEISKDQLPGPAWAVKP